MLCYDISIFCFKGWWQRDIPGCVMSPRGSETPETEVMTYVWRRRLLRSLEGAWYTPSGKVSFCVA